MTTDANRLRQILINLISNAIKYTQKGWVKIRVTSEDNYILFIVQDTGVGISPEQFSRMFTAFTKIMRNRDLNK